MRLVIVAVGEKLPNWAETAAVDYIGRMPRTAPTSLMSVRTEPRRANRTSTQCMQAEATRIEAAIPAGARRIVLDEHGRDQTTRRLADRLARWLAEGRDCAFLLGGPDGLDSALKGTADETWRLSSLTLPHALARVILAEQLYRAMSILENHPYHRGE